MQYSSDEISVDSDHQQLDGARGLKYLPHWPSVNIEFQDLVYTVPDISGKSKVKIKSSKLEYIYWGYQRSFSSFFSLKKILSYFWSQLEGAFSFFSMGYFEVLIYDAPRSVHTELWWNWHWKLFELNSTDSFLCIHINLLKWKR